jgi:hypothetical protein
MIDLCYIRLLSGHRELVRQQARFTLGKVAKPVVAKKAPAVHDDARDITPALADCQLHCAIHLGQTHHISGEGKGAKHKANGV